MALIVDVYIPFASIVVVYRSEDVMSNTVAYAKYHLTGFEDVPKLPVILKKFVELKLPLDPVPHLTFPMYSAQFPVPAVLVSQVIVPPFPIALV